MLLEPLSDPVAVRSGAATLVSETAGTGSPIVFLHAGVADRRSWRPVAHLLAHDHLVLAYDRRGFGDTTGSPEQFDHVDDLLRVLDHHELARAVLVGNSQGGRVALDAALTHTDRVAGVVLVAALWTGAPAPEDPWPDWLVDIVRIGDELDDTADLDRINDFEARFWLDGPRGPTGRVVGPARTLFREMNARALAVEAAGGVGEEMTHEPVWDQLATLHLPVAVIECARDLPWATARGRAAVEMLPEATYAELDTAHLPGLEQPEALAAEIRRFTPRAWGSRPAANEPDAPRTRPRPDVGDARGPTGPPVRHE
jgi:pimeloyl-ACP methyl ester carboxylesterase